MTANQNRGRIWSFYKEAPGGKNFFTALFVLVASSVAFGQSKIDSPNQSNAQNENLHFEHIGIEEGLLNENITAIFQDSKGFMWFGTFDGLYKYDAYSFTKYQFDPSDSNSLSQNFIYTIFEDKYGTIWVSTFEGLCKFDRFTEKFTRYKPLPDAKFFNPNISAISEDIYGMLWVGSTSGELCRFDRKTGKFLQDSFDFDYCINVIYRDSAGTLWVGSATGLHEIKLTPAKGSQPSDVQIKNHVNDPADPNSLVSDTVASVMEDRTGILWIGTNNGLSSFNKKTGTWKRYQNVRGDIHSISSNNLAVFWFGNGIKEDHDGNLWISTAKGLNRLNRDRTLFTSYFHNPNDNYSLSSDYIVCLQIDRAGILWAATKAGPSIGASWGSKLNKTNLNRKAFGLRRNNPTDINSLSNNQVTAIVEDSAGIIWIGTHAGGLNKWDKRTNQFTHFRSDPANPEGLKHDAIAAMLEDRHGHLWICNGDVLSRLNRQTSEFTHYTGDHRVIFSITEDQQGLLWLGTANGIRSFDEKTREFGNYYRYDPKNPDGISDGTAQTIFADSKGNIWIGYGSMGTDKYDKKTKRFSHYKHNPRDSFSISSNIVFSFYEDSKGNLWLGSWAGGLSYFDYKKESFKTFTDKDGLAGTTVFSIVEENSGYLWLGTRNGLSRFDPAKKTFTNYEYKDGLQGNIFAAGYLERGARFKGRDGTLYFGGSNGFNFFNPLELKTNSYKAPIVITQFKIFDKLVKGANESKEIVLKHNQNYFSFEFSSLSFYNPAKNQYAYKLEGVDKDWVLSGSRRYVSYTNIAPGKYTFRVKGTNNDGVWNEKGTYITIVVNPPWWRTWPAYVVYSLLIAVAIWAIVHYRSRSLRRKLEQQKKELQLTELQQQKTELEMQALRAQMNPHFIFNSLNSINMFILENNKLQASEYLSKFSRLVRLILQNSQEKFIPLERELEALQLYLELETLRFENRFGYKIVADDEVDCTVLKVPPLIIQPYAENAIWHGLMHKKEKGHLVIEIFLIEPMLYCKITDDGIGRKKSAEFKSKPTSTYKSMGMKITKSRLEMIEKTNANNNVEIKDLVYADGSAAGTEVLIKIPYYD
ncbi:MAG TPA: two-component regulator propeller domain-containing protein [Parafilimonas sp.]|nr:two-component regulator propeller domain-containing protein [Parafilimonas sp.]